MKFYLKEKFKCSWLVYPLVIDRPSGLQQLSHCSNPPPENSFPMFLGPQRSFLSDLFLKSPIPPAPAVTLAGFTPIPASTSVPYRAIQKPDLCQGWYHSKEPHTSILIPGDIYRLLSFSLSNFSSNLSYTACPLHTAHKCYQQA